MRHIRGEWPSLLKLSEFFFYRKSIPNKEAIECISVLIGRIYKIVNNNPARYGHCCRTGRKNNGGDDTQPLKIFIRNIFTPSVFGTHYHAIVFYYSSMPT